MLLFVPLDFGFSSWSKPTTQVNVYDDVTVTIHDDVTVTVYVGS